MNYSLIRPATGIRNVGNFNNNTKQQQLVALAHEKRQVGREVVEFVCACHKRCWSYAKIISVLHNYGLIFMTVCISHSDAPVHIYYICYMTAYLLYHQLGVATSSSGK